MTSNRQNSGIAKNIIGQTRESWMMSAQFLSGYRRRLFVVKLSTSHITETEVSREQDATPPVDGTSPSFCWRLSQEVKQSI